MSEEPLLQFFVDSRLFRPNHLDLAKVFAACASALCNELPRNAERTIMLRHLLDARDAAMRAIVAQPFDAKPDIKIVSADGVVR